MKPCLRGGTTRYDVRYDCALQFFRTEARRNLWRNRLYFDTEPAACHPAVRLQLRDDVMDCRSRNSKADAHASAGWREDHRVHADHSAADIERGAARVATVNRRIDLNKARIWAVSDVAAD